MLAGASKGPQDALMCYEVLHVMSLKAMKMSLSQIYVLGVNSKCLGRYIKLQSSDLVFVLGHQKKGPAKTKGQMSAGQVLGESSTWEEREKRRENRLEKH